MKRFLSALVALLMMTVMWAAFIPQEASAKPHILFHVKQVRLVSPGKAAIVGYFANDGDTTGYAKWTELGLILKTDNGRILWQDYGIRHYMDVKVPAHRTVNYTFYVRNSDIPKYNKHFTWRIVKPRTHWSKTAG